ncbi:hypothetical protein [Chromohalobacter sp. 296-RDG]|uniref:hypothetical protein n=1 Tax=Chromohalobacter sp. 296-RDG TaxID=2994062 RepID=UPI002469C542|nr:hypothetical protein [Chromohalobacter sp. 296-RDG]
MKCSAEAFACAFLAMMPVASLAQTDLPLLGSGNLAVTGAKSSHVWLANIESATVKNGHIYYDQHVRPKQEEIAGDPPRREIVFRTKLDCAELKEELLSAHIRDYYTGQYAEGSVPMESTGAKTIRRDGVNYDICKSYINGATLSEALLSQHHKGLKNLPLYAIPADRADKELLQYLSDHNPAF